MHGLPRPQRHKNLLSPDQIPHPIRNIVATLVEHGYDAKVVGGCIRDLLLGIQPKDFDVVTDAKPHEIKALFSRAFVIGRRFKLVHVQHGREITEVSTFRRLAKRKSSRSKNQLNLFGSIEDDHYLRDFTINALYFDMESEEIIDYCGGLQDVYKRQLRCIGDPNRRFTEDPCRVLRAVRFISKLPLKLESRLRKSMRKHAESLKSVKPARLENELQKMFLNGAAASAYLNLERLDLLEILFPSVESDNSLALRAMQNTDERVADDKNVTLAFLLAAMHWDQFKTLGNYDPTGRMSIAKSIAAAESILKRQREILRVTKQARDFIVETWTLQTRLERERPTRVREVLSHNRFRAAYDLLVLRESVGEASTHMAQWWTDLQGMDEEEQSSAIQQMKPKLRSKRRKRKQAVEAIATTTS